MYDLYGDAVVPGWTPVTDEFAEELNAWDATDNIMFLPEPITNA